ncbi:type VI-A CRISPR-associated RNA-guided ribonuclease Cas13a [Parvibaculum sp.]|uniref:type VI-A CRISPR-associated RNA-guided ribonuclease Cas13a n=1 Tax=Parvibaculum sp. TaxID=2024848 RepID=UPI0034A03908
MRIVRPYGRSDVESGDASARKRVLRLRDELQTPRDITEFASAHDELVIAQWISAIDKIATKPSGDKSATQEQREFRDRLGKAAWVLLEARDLLPGLKDATRGQHLAALWRTKVAPYGKAEYKPRGKNPPPSAKGRWYARFAGEAEPAKTDATEIAARIHEHLHVAEYRLSGDVPKRRVGRIEARARSIAGNVLRDRPHKNDDWTEADCEAYARAGNVAGEIRQAAERRESGNDGSSRRSVTVDIAGTALYAHYAKVFRASDGIRLSIEDAKQQCPGLFNLHMAVKDCYARILKHHGKDRREHGNERRKVSLLLPDTMPDLFALVEKKIVNSDLSALVRLGKIIHYEASTSGEDDSPADPVDHWPADIAASVWWSSDGQARIKRNEAFVRVWRHVLALAARTLKDWADPQSRIEDDILLAGPIGRAIGRDFDAGGFDRKLDLLFGSRAATFRGAGDDAFHKEILEAALRGVAGLRNAAFHFKGLGGFVGVLTASSPKPDALAAARTLWNDDTGERVAQLLKTLRGVHLEHFFGEPECRRLVAEMSGVAPAVLPLPRFGRMLLRTENVRKNTKDWTRLPPSANRTDLEVPARHCQYTALKLLYERPFRRWLALRDAAALNGYISRAVERATRAAKEMNTKGDPDRREVIASRAARLGHLAKGDTIESFFFRLSAETASEMRVQRGYDSDPDNAREQAAFIEELKCDVVALAFDGYLKEADFGFLLELKADTPKPDDRQFDLDTFSPPPAGVTAAEDWQTLLYFLMHLVPVDEIGRLLHQIRKWNILAGRPGATEVEASRERAVRICAVLELYLDMHDAKFEGGTALASAEAFADFVENPEAFEAAFPSQPGGEGDTRIPKRGLREIMRFGHLPALRKIFEAHRISSADISRLREAEAPRDGGKSGIAAWQEKRETLHEKWTREKREKKEFANEDRRAYVEALREVIRYRHLAAHVTLTNHVRLHRLLMSVLGRLVDYSGLWERDLYFVALALVHHAGRQPGEVFEPEGLDRLGKGRIVDAVRRLGPGADGDTVRADLYRYFGLTFDGSKNPLVDIRNNFAHFNMLKNAHLPVDLTNCVNDARKLMAYDRKLKNAVSQSVIELLARENLDLAWMMGADHRLGAAKLATRQAPHMGGKRDMRDRQPDARGRPVNHAILENLHGGDFVAMAAALFGGTAESRPDIVSLDLDRIDWSGTADGRKANGGPKIRTRGDKRHGHGGKNSHRKQKKR